MRYGWYGTAALRTVLREEERRAIWRDYTAEMLWSVGKLLAKEWKIPHYRDLIAPRRPEGPEQSAEEIKQHLLQVLGGEPT